MTTLYFDNTLIITLPKRVNKHNSSNIAQIGLSKENNCVISKKEKSRTYGTKGITTKGKRLVSNASKILEAKYGVKNIGFCTLTLPKLTKQQLKTLNAKWADVVDRYFKELSRVVQRKTNKPLEYVAVFEIQEKRFKATGQSYPHIHYVYPCRFKSKRDWLVSANQKREIWARILTNFFNLHNLPLSKKESFKASVDCQVVKKSVGGYLSKYLSKGGEMLEEIQKTNVLPKQWWTASKIMKQMYQDSIVHLKFEQVAEIFDKPEQYKAQKLITYYKYLSVDIEGKDYCFAMVAKASKTLANSLRPEKYMVKFEYSNFGSDKGN